MPTGSYNEGSMTAVSRVCNITNQTWTISETPRRHVNRFIPSPAAVHQFLIMIESQIVTGEVI